MGTIAASPVQIGGETVGPGQRRNLRLPLGSRPDGSPMSLPVIVVNGRAPGPKMGVIAGIHGEEYEGPEGLRRFLAGIDPNELCGTVVAAPQANPLAHESFSRVGAVDYLDLNRAFPGNGNGFLTQRIADLLVREIVAKVDCLIDLHGGGLAYDLVPYVGFNSTPGAVGEASFALAKSFGIELLYGSTPFPNVLRLEAAKRDIPAILVEVGGEGRLNPELVPIVERGLHNAAVHLGALEGQKTGLPDRFKLLKAPAAGEFMQSPTGGFMVSKACVGDQVEKGQLLAQLIDVFGSEIARIEAPVTGILISYRTIPVTRTGDWTYAVIPVVGEAGANTPLSEIAALLQPES